MPSLFLSGALWEEEEEVQCSAKVINRSSGIAGAHRRHVAASSPLGQPPSSSPCGGGAAAAAFVV